jgi:hypothetical protein
MLKSVLGSFANMEQNQVIPPDVYTSMYNTVTSLLISALVKQYPSDPVVIDILRPFVKVEQIPIKTGFFELPEDYRDILGTPNISAKTDGSGECGDDDNITNEAEFKNATLKSKCRQRPVIIVPQAEFAIRTTSSYKFPTYNDPIGYMYGENKIKVCPYDLTKVELMYVVKEKKYRYGYITQPDDTYIFDKNTSIESEWTSAAFEPIFNALSNLIAAYTRDTDLRDWAMILTQKGIF